VQDYFRIAVVGAPRPHAERLEFLSQLCVVVDLAVEHDRDSPGLINHWLRGGIAEVQNRESAMAQSHATVR
jgi:hypothetical protein